jgi:N-acetylneuraminic acid mutarotase
MTAKYRHLQCVFVLLLVVAANSFAGGWVQVSELPTLRIAEAAAAVNDKLYLIGGFNWDENLGGSAPPIARVDVYDTRTNTWHKVADIPTPRIVPQATVFSSEIYVFGGYDRTAIRGEPHKKTVEMYDTRTNTWTQKRDMPTLRRDFGAGVVGGKIYIIGGSVFDKQSGKQVSTDLVEAYDPLTNRWERHADMPTKRHRIDAAVVDGANVVLYRVGESGGSAYINLHFDDETHKVCKIYPDKANDQNSFFKEVAGILPVEPIGKLTTTWADIKRND